MGLLKGFRLFLERRVKTIQKNRHIKISDKKAAKKISCLSEKKELTKEQKKEIQAFYKRLTGNTVSPLWHQYFYSRTGVYSKEYMPVGLYESELLGRANRMDLYNAYVDKNLDELLLPTVRHPHTILRNIRGYYYFEGKPVSRDEAITLCQNIENAIMKPSRAAIGYGVVGLSVKNGITNVQGLSIGQLFDKYKEDFLIQEKLQQHERMSELNPTSVNTIRILTFRSGMEILVVYTVVRIGRKGQVIDNQMAGGISAKINPDGKLCKYGFGKLGDDKLEETDTGVVLEGYEIPSYHVAIETVKNLHYQLPLFDLVGWDIAIGIDGEPILIEWNGETGPSQTACGTGFGELTERIIKEIWPRKNTRFV